MARPIEDHSLDQLFRDARSHQHWGDEAVSETELRAIYELTKFGPTSANCSPARFVWVTSAEGKQRLARHASTQNGPKILKAPLTVIVGYDLAFAEKIPQLFPAMPTAKDWFADPAVAQTTAIRNGTLQGGYFILAVRALGLDVGAMSGFDNAGVDQEFFAGTSIKSNFLCSVGRGDASKLGPRPPRLSFEEAGWIA